MAKSSMNQPSNYHSEIQIEVIISEENNRQTLTQMKEMSKGRDTKAPTSRREPKFPTWSKSNAT
jgi:hypothetical protein